METIKEPIFDSKEISQVLINEIEKSLERLRSVHTAIELLQDKALVVDLERSALDAMIALTGMKIDLKSFQQKETQNEESDLTKN